MPKINFLLFLLLYHLYNSIQSVTMFQPPFIPAKSTHQMYLKQALQDLFTPYLSQA